MEKTRILHENNRTGAEQDREIEALRRRVTELEQRESEYSESKEKWKNLVGALQQREREVTGLLEGARAVLEHQQFERAARSIFDTCCRLTGAVAGYVALLSDDGSENEVLFLESGGAPCTVDPALPMPIRGLRAESYRTGEVVYDNDFFNSQWMKFMPKGHVKLRNVMFAPLVIDGKTVGLMGMSNKPGDFNENDARLAKAFGELAAVALRNSLTLERLETEQERYKTVTEFSNDWVYWLDQNGDIRYVSPAFQTLTGYTPAEFATFQEIFDTLIHPADREEFQRHHQSALQGQSTSGIEFRIVTKEGEEKWISHVCKAISDSSGTFLGVRAANNDITERKQIEREREQVIKDLQDALAKVRTLDGLLPICANCKKIRDDTGYWNRLEKYIQDRSDAEFSHSICPDCAYQLYGETFE